MENDPNKNDTKPEILNRNLNCMMFMKFINVVRDILDILTQCNRSNSSATCTSSLGFSRLYILMLGFIVT